MTTPRELGLPDEMLRRAHSIAEGSGEWTPPVPRHAATVVLLRDTDDGVEVFLMRRVSTMAFAAGMHVFPGGVVDPDDSTVTLQLGRNDTTESLDQRLTAPPGLGSALVAAAARETFEECGVLLVSPIGDTVNLEMALDDERWEPRRRALLEGDRAFSELLDGDGLAVDASSIRPWAHWITPEVDNRRYNTRFFVAAIPEGQRARDLGGEADRVHWTTPASALKRHEAGELAMMLPTVDTLTALLPFSSAHEVIAAADERVVRPLMPQATFDDHGSITWGLVDQSTGDVVLELDTPTPGTMSRKESP